jgi:hypothetical protein
MSDTGAVLGLLTAAFGLAGLGVFIAGQDAKAIHKRCATLDQGNTITFNIAADPAAMTPEQRQAFETASEAARQFDNKHGSYWSYTDKDACARNHTDYAAGSHLVTNAHVCAVFETYKPAIVGYLAAENNPSLSVPLYASKFGNTALRPDGRELIFIR